MRISPEAIYQSLYIEGRGALGASSSGTSARAGRCASEGAVAAQDLGARHAGDAHQRTPGGSADRAVPGTWGDLLIGLERSAVGTVVERKTRYTLLVHLPREEGYRHKEAEERSGIGRLRRHHDEERPREHDVDRSRTSWRGR